MKSLRQFFNEGEENEINESPSILKPRDQKKVGYDGPPQKFEFKQDAKTKKDTEGLKKIKDKLLSIREKRPKPFFDDKSQTDLNSFWLYVTFYSSILLDDETLYEKCFNIRFW